MATVQEYDVPYGWVFRWDPSRRLEGRYRRLLRVLDAAAFSGGGAATTGATAANLNELIDVVRGHGLSPRALLRTSWRHHVDVVERGEAAVREYVGRIRWHKDHAHWSEHKLVLRANGEADGFVFSADLDCTVLEVLCWGARGEAALDDVLATAARQIRATREV